MVKIVLSTGELDVAENVSVPITFNIGDIRDLTSRKGTFSKSIVLEGTKNNNELLGHYYDVNIQAGTFNINTLTKCQLIQNGVPILDDALLQLVSVNKVQTNNKYEDEVTYTVLIKDSRAEFFTAITNANLTDLDFSDLNHVFGSSTIVSSFSHTVVDGYKYLMPYINNNIYNSNDFKPAIYAKTYFDRIFSNAGFTYTWNDLSSAHFDKLLIPYNGDVNNQDYEDYKVEANTTLNYTEIQPLGVNLSFSQPVTNLVETLDSQNIYDPLTGVYTSPFSTSAIAGELYIYSVSVAGSIELNNVSGFPAQLRQPGNFQTNQSNRYRIYLEVLVGSSVNVRVYSSAEVYAEFRAPSTLLPPGNTTILNFNETINVPAVFSSLGFGNTGSITSGDLQILNVGVEVTPFFGNPAPGIPQQNLMQFLSVTAPFTALRQVNTTLDLTSIQVSIVPSSNVNVLGSTLFINQYVPVEIKQSDFVKAIFQMYNLYIDTDPDNANNLILRHRDEYYDSGAEKNWSEKLAKDKQQDLMFLPDVTNKKLKLTYAPDEDSPNVAYTQATGEIYGQIEYTFDNEYVKGVDTKELLFSPTPIVKTNFDAFVPNISGQAPNVNIRILYDGGLGSCQPFDIVDFGTTGQFAQTSYPVLGHFNDPLFPTFDINFGTNDYYFYEVGTLTNNNLYNLYWRRTVNQINVGKMLIAYFDLNELDIQTLKLNDKIYIDNSWWNINKIQDYNANNNQLTKVELISVDTEIDLARFNINNGLPIGIGVTERSLQTVNDSINNTNNIILPGADVIVKGSGNVVVAGVKGLIIGDGQTLSDDGIVTKNLTVTGTINGIAQVTYNRYIATISQSGTADPTVVVLENTIGDIVWTRAAVGDYLGTLVGAFPDQDKTYLIIGQSQNDRFSMNYIDPDNVNIITLDSAGVNQDTLLGFTTIEIRVY